jgi:transporter family-2 protein
MTPSIGAGTFLAIALLMFLAGMGIPVMASLNASLGQHLASPAAASAILFAGGLVLTALITLATGMPPAKAITSVPPWLFTGAIFVVFYILSITWAAPRVGIANAVFFVLLGQLVAAAGIEHFGLLGAAQSAITLRRVVGIVVMAIGVYLAKRPQ